MNVNNEQNNQFQQEFKPDIAALMQTQFTNGSQCGVNMLETQSVNASSAQIYGSQVYGVNVGVGGLQLGSAAPKSESGSYNDLFISTASDQYSVGVGLGGGTDIMAGASTPPGGSTTSSKYQCAICGDRASGKHYGVFSCEGCKGFFKRTVRKDLTYTCRDERNCPIDKRQRNRCQFCRYNRCLAAGMKREAVQEERLRAKEKAAASGYVDTIDYRRVLQAEVASDPCDTEGRGPGALATEVQMQGAQPSLVAAADRQLYMLVEWAKRLPHFVELPLDDQIALLRAGWNELLIAAFAFRSTQLADADALLIANGVLVRRDAAHSLGVGAIFDRVLVELVAKMREMKLDRVEIGCLRAIILFNADVKSLQCVADVEAAREKYYTTLEEYCKATYPAEPARFARILLRMPALRSIGLKCLEQLFFFKLLGESPADSFLVEMLNETLLKNADDYHQSPPPPPPPPPVGLPQLSTAGGAQPRLAYAAGGVYSNAGALNAGF